MTGLGAVRQGMGRLRRSRLGTAWPGQFSAGLGKAGSGPAVTARHGPARPGQVRPVSAKRGSRGLVGQDVAGIGLAGSGGQGEARRGAARPGPAGLGAARSGVGAWRAWLGGQGGVGLVVARRGEAWRALACPGEVRRSRHGEVGFGME
jgi:hypothetical protein